MITGVLIARQLAKRNPPLQDKGRGVVNLPRIDNALASDIRGLAVCIDCQTR